MNRIRRHGSLVAACLVAGLAAGGCEKVPADADAKSAAAADAPRLVLVVLVDALRADALSCYGGPAGASPAIDAFAQNALVFEHAFAAAPWTKPSVPSLFTGLPPSRHGVFEGSSRDVEGRITSDVLSPQALTLAEVMRDAGYGTAAFVQNAQLKPFLGFDQGFDVYREGVGDGARIHAEFLEWFDAQRALDSAKPLFAYLHVLDVHEPYMPPADALAHFPAAPDAPRLDRQAQKDLADAVDAKTHRVTPQETAELRRLYQACVRGYDAKFGALVDALRARGAWDDALVVFTSDHGEEFGEYGELGHGHSLRDSLLRVPLVVKAPGRSNTTPRRIERSASSLDVLPTLAERVGAHGLPGLSGLPGRDLLSGAGDTPIVAEMVHGPEYTRALRSPGWKVVESFRAAKSNLVKAPMEPRKLLAEGMRIELKVKGERADLEASRVTLEVGTDDDIEVRGAIRDLDVAAGTFKIGPFSIERAPETSLPDGVRVGDVLDVDGMVIDAGRLRAHKIQPRTDKAGSRSIKIEGPIEKVFDHGDEVGIAGVRVEIDGDATWEGFEVAGQLAGGRLDRKQLVNSVLFDPSRFTRTVDVFDLGADPLEKAPSTNLQEGMLGKLEAAIRVHLGTVAGLGSGTFALDAETIQRLEETGYGAGN